MDGETRGEFCGDRSPTLEGQPTYFQAFLFQNHFSCLGRLTDASGWEGRKQAEFSLESISEKGKLCSKQKASDDPKPNLSNARTMKNDFKYGKRRLALSEKAIAVGKKPIFLMAITSFAFAAYKKKWFNRSEWPWPKNRIIMRIIMFMSYISRFAAFFADQDTKTSSPFFCNNNTEAAAAVVVVVVAAGFVPVAKKKSRSIESSCWSNDASQINSDWRRRRSLG